MAPVDRGNPFLPPGPKPPLGGLRATAQSVLARLQPDSEAHSIPNVPFERANSSHAHRVSAIHTATEVEFDEALRSQPALGILSSTQLPADETTSLFPHHPDSLHSAHEEGLSHELLHRLIAEIKEHQLNDNRELLRAAIDDLDRAIVLTDPFDGLYRSAIEHLRYWCRTSGELPTSCMIEDIVDFDIQRPLSSTALSDVYRGRLLGAPVAVKILRLHEDDKAQAQRSFRNEVVTWKCLRHPNIVAFMGTSNICPVCLVSEWMPEGTLFAFLERNPKEHRVRYINHILQGLDFMHRLGVIHGDLKAVNVLVDEGKMARLADFGVATVLHNSTIMATTMNGNGVGGTVRWQAPELHGCFDSEGEDAIRPSIHTDVYALAVTLWELFTLLAPFPHVRADTGVLLRVFMGERPTKPTDCENVGFSDMLWKVMQRGWDAEAGLRPPLAEFATALGGTMEKPAFQANIGNAKLFPFPGIMHLDEERNRSKNAIAVAPSLSISASLPDIASSGGSTSGGPSSWSAATSRQRELKLPLSHQKSNTGLFARFQSPTHSQAEYFDVSQPSGTVSPSSSTRDHKQIREKSSVKRWLSTSSKKLFSPVSRLETLSILRFPTPIVPALFASSKEKSSKRYQQAVEAISRVRTILGIAEKAFGAGATDGVQATINALAEGLKVVQTRLENVKELYALALTFQVILGILASYNGSNASEVPHDIKNRFMRFRDALVELSQEWEKHNGSRRVKQHLDAESVNKDIADLNLKIQQALARLLLETTLSRRIVGNGEPLPLHSMVGCHLPAILQGSQDTLASTQAQAVEAAAERQPDLDDTLLKSKLMPVASASWDAYDSKVDNCLPGTRVQVLAEIDAWAHSGSSGSTVFWLNGLAGTGKSTIARTLCGTLAKAGLLGPTFFASRGSPDRRRPVSIVHTLAYQLACSDKAMRHRLCDILREDPNVPSCDLATQISSLIAQPLRHRAGSAQSFVLVLDALDECYVEDGQEGGQLLPLLADALSALPTVRLFVTSRDKMGIRRIFDRIRRSRLEGALETVWLHIESSIVREDIRAYLVHSFRSIVKERTDDAFPDEWPAGAALTTLLDRAGQLFIFAATVVRYIRDDYGVDGPVARLEQLMQTTPDGVTYPYSMLDQLYRSILDKAVDVGNEDSARLCSQVRKVFGVLALVQSEILTPAILAQFVGLPLDAFFRIACRLSAVVTIDGDKPLRLVHPSFRDFVLDSSRCQDERFHVRSKEEHLALAVLSLKLMNSQLRYNICAIENPGTANSHVRDLATRLRVNIPEAVQYACRYWATHLASAGYEVSGDLLGEVDAFCNHHLLHWLEVLSLLGELSSAVGILSNAIAWCNTHAHEYAELLADASRLVDVYGHPISSHALHTYHSGLVTMPAGPLQRTSEASILRCIPRLTTARASRWPVLTQALKCHASDVNSVAFSPEGQRVVSGSSDMSVRIWNTLDGRRMAAPLLGHSGSVQCVAFSPDGRYIASGSSDETVRIWDANSGVQTALLQGHTDGVRSITFSPDGQRAVSGSDDQSLRIWDLDTGLQTAKLEGHTHCVNAVVFCPIGDRDRLASGSDDTTVRVWDLATYTQTHFLEGHSDSVSVVAFSPDGKYLVSGSADRTVRVWDVLTGSAISILTGHSSRVLSVAFTPDGRRVHSGCDEYTVRIWSDMRTSAGEELILPAGDGDVLTSAVFSPDRQRMVTGSNHGIIRIWDSTLRRSAEPTTSEPLVANSRACAVAISSDGRRVAAASTRDHTVHLWDVISSEPRRDGARDRPAPGTLTALDGLPLGHGEVESPVRLRELVGHTKDVLSVAFSSNARYLASGSHDMSVRIWDASTGEAFARLDGHADPVHFVSFSPSGQHVISVSNHSARVWEVSSSTEVAVKKLSGCSPGLVVWLDDGTVQVPALGEWRWRVKGQLPDGSDSPGVATDVLTHDRRSTVHSLTWDQDSGWVLLKTQRRQHSTASTTRLCWLPLERRGPSYTSCSHAIFIRATSGLNTVLDFSATLELLGETTGWSRADQ